MAIIRFFALSYLFLCPPAAQARDQLKELYKSTIEADVEQLRADLTILFLITKEAQGHIAFDELGAAELRRMIETRTVQEEITDTFLSPYERKVVEGLVQRYREIDDNLQSLHLAEEAKYLAKHAERNFLRTLDAMKMAGEENITEDIRVEAAQKMWNAYLRLRVLSRYSGMLLYVRHEVKPELKASEQRVFRQNLRQSLMLFAAATMGGVLGALAKGADAFFPAWARSGEILHGGVIATLTLAPILIALGRMIYVVAEKSEKDLEEDKQKITSEHDQAMSRELFHRSILSYLRHSKELDDARDKIAKVFGSALDCLQVDAALLLKGGVGQ